MAASAIPQREQRLTAALEAGSRIDAVVALGAFRGELAEAARVTLQRMLRAGEGSVRGSRCGRVLDVVDAALVLDELRDEETGMAAMEAAVDMLAVSLPPARARARAPGPPSLPGVWASRWAAHTDDWGRPAQAAGAAFRLGERLPGLQAALRGAVEVSFGAPKAPSTPLEVSADDLVEAACALLVATPGFREAACVALARGAWSAELRGDGGAALGPVWAFVEESRAWAVRRGRLRGGVPPVLVGPVPPRTEFRAALADAASREAVHSFGVVHALAGALADLEARGSERVRRAARIALLGSRATWSPATPPGRRAAPASDGTD